MVIDSSKAVTDENKAMIALIKTVMLRESRPEPGGSTHKEQRGLHKLSLLR